MANLTLDLGVVEEASELQPTPNAWLVVYRRRRTSGGLFHHTTVPPGRPYQRSLTERFYDLVAWRVRADQLENRFSQRFEHVGMVHDLTLHFRLETKVVDPTKVVDRLTTDPLARVQQEVESLVGGEIRRFDLEAIRRDPTAMGQRALDLETGDLAGRRSTVRKRLVAVATDLGFELFGLDVDCVLSERYLEPLVKQDEARRKVSVIRAESQVQELQQDVDAEQALRKEELQQGLATLRRRGKAADALLDRLDQAVGRIANQISDPRDLQHVIKDMSNVVQQVRSVVGSEDGQPIALPRPSSTLLIAGEGPTLSTSLISVLRETVEQIGSLALPSGESERWTALALRAIAAALDPESDPDADFVRVGEEVDRLLDPASLSETQWSFLDRLRDRGSLRQALGLDT